MTITYEPIAPPIIENTTMRKMIADGTHRTTRIAPVEGYVLHDNNLDDVALDDITGMPTDEILLGYKEGEISVGHDYDFKENPRELYAVPRSSVPEDRIF
jgi:hypothetical protein